MIKLNYQKFLKYEMIATIISISIPGGLMILLLVLSNAQHGSKFAISFIWDMIKNDTVTQIILSCLFIISCVFFSYIAIEESLEEISKPNAVRIGNRYRNLKKS